MIPIAYKNCQSCGMPLKKDKNGGGSNSDGSISQMYCSHCFQKGEFTQPDITVTRMKDLVKGKLKDMGFPGFVAGFFTKGIPGLAMEIKNPGLWGAFPSILP